MPAPTPVAYSGPGFLMKISDSTGANFTVVALSKDVTGPSIAVAKSDVSTQDMANRFRLYDPELADAGVFATTIFYRPENASHAAVLAACIAGTMLNVQLYNNPPTNSRYWSAGGFFTKFDQKGPVGGPMEAAIEFQLSGAPVQN